MLDTPIEEVAYVTGKETELEIAPETFVTLTCRVPCDAVMAEEENVATICVPEAFTVAELDGTEPKPTRVRVTVAF